MSTSLPTNRYFLRAPGAAEPQLGLAQSYWALQQRTLPIIEAVEQAWDEGFHYFEAGLREERMADVRSILKRTPVRLIAQGWAETAPEAEVYFQRAAELGAVAINLHLGHAYLTHQEAIQILDEAHTMSERYRLPLLLETHRGRMTQDLFRTAPLMPHIQSAGLVLDVSHYIVAGEGVGGSEAKFFACMEPLLATTAMIHGRVSNGQQVQVQASSPLAHAAMTRDLWQRAMKQWLDNAPHDAVLIFEPELGPPPYAYVLQDGMESFDRADESQTLVQMARHAWDAAQAEQRGEA